MSIIQEIIIPIVNTGNFDSKFASDLLGGLAFHSGGVSLNIFSSEDVRMEAWTRGPLFVAPTELARANKLAMERHFLAEWNGDIEATMATMHSDQPWQRIPALKVEVNGTAAVRDYYLRRFSTWPGPAMEYFERVSIVDTCLYVEGVLRVTPKGEFGAVRTEATMLSAPALIVVDFRDGLVLGETVYVDAASLNGETYGQDASYRDDNEVSTT